MAINYVKIITAAFHSNTAALHPKISTFLKYELKLKNERTPSTFSKYV